MAAPLVSGLLGAGAPGATTLAVGLGVVAAWEYARLLRLAWADRVVLTSVVAAMPVLAWLVPTAPARLLCALPALTMLPIVLSGDVAGGAQRAGGLVFGAVWIGALAGLVSLGPQALPLFIAVSVADVAAWCGGRLVGGPRLSRLSPAKTWSGVLAGGAGGLGVLALCHAMTPILAVAVVVGGPFGDLIESAVKRSAGVKDAGGWLPGFGGLLDRIDSLLVALLVAMVLR
jgi:phosphatidate cytidylyltransferase